jgi:pimeloyl-ACP methyl ester carboxylesterase
MFIERGGSRLFCQVKGTGEPFLVFVHGVATGHEVWSEHVRYFAASRKVVALDLRGHGQSDPADDYPQELFVADLNAVLDSNQLRHPVLAGWSLGGSIAIRRKTILCVLPHTRTRHGSRLRNSTSSEAVLMAAHEGGTP